MEYILPALAVLLVGFIAFLIIRAACFNPKNDVKVLENEEVFDKDIVISRLAELVKCKTISYGDKSLEDNAEFDKLIALLPKLYPNVFKVCEYSELPDRALLFRWKGKNDGDPAVLMAHYDVVPVNEDMWEKPPFEAIRNNAAACKAGERGSACLPCRCGLSSVFETVRKDALSAHFRESGDLLCRSA